MINKSLMLQQNNQLLYLMFNSFCSRNTKKYVFLQFFLMILWCCENVHIYNNTSQLISTNRLVGANLEEAGSILIAISIGKCRQEKYQPVCLGYKAFLFFSVLRALIGLLIVDRL